MKPRAFLLFLVMATACRDPKASEYPSHADCADDNAAGPMDVLEIRVMQQEKYSGTYEIDTSGVISFPNIGVVQAGGKAPLAIEADIQARLSDGYLRNPQVTVQFKERRSKKVSVFGEVRRGSVMPFGEGMTVSAVIADAGGFTARAWENAVKVTRKSPAGAQEFTVPVRNIVNGSAKPFPMCPGDSVYVPKSPI